MSTKSEEKMYKALFDLNPDGIVILNTDGNIQDCNAALTQLTGLKKEELTGRHFLNIAESFEVQLSDMPGQFQSLLKSTKEKSVEFGWKNKKGEYRYAEAHIKAIKEGRGISGLMVIMRDLTGRKSAEDDLAASEAEFREIFNSTNEAIFIDDAETGKMLDCNEQTVKMYGYESKEDILRGNIGDLSAGFAPWDEAGAQKEISKALEQGRHTFEWLAKKKDGTTFRAEVSLKKTVIGGEGRILAVVRDISGRKAMEEKLGIQSGLLDSAPASVTVHDFEGRFLYANEQTLVYHGYTRQEFMMLSLHDIDVPESEEKITERMALIRKNGQAVFEVEHYRKDGSKFPLEVFVKPAEWEGRDVFLSMAVDITERKRIQDELRDSENFIKAVMDNLPTGVAVNTVDPSVKFSYINTNFIKYYRTTREALSNPDAFWEVVYEDSAFREKQKKRVVDDCVSGDPERMYWEDIPLTRKGEKTTFICARNTPVPGKNIMISTVWDVTDRKYAEEALRQSEEKHRQLFETMSQGVIYQAADGSIISANPAAERILGLSFDQMSGKTSMDPRWRMIREDGSEVPGSEHPAMTALRTGEKTGPVTRGIYIPEKEEYAWLLITAIPLFHPEEEKPFQAYATFEDITERRQAEDALSFRLQFQKIATESASRFVDMFAENFDDVINETLQNLGELFNMDRGYVFMFSDGLDSMSNTHEWCASGIQSQKDKIQNVLTDSMPWWKEKILKRKTVHIPDVAALPEEAGNEREHFQSQKIQSLICLPIQNMYGELTGFLGFDAVKKSYDWQDEQISMLQLFADIMGGALERRRMFNDLKNSEAQYRTLFETMPNGYYLSSHEGYILNANTAFVNMLGYSSLDELKSVYIPEAIYAEQSDRDSLPYYNEEFVDQIEIYRLKRKDGQIIMIEDNSRYIKDSEGNVLYHEGICRDITGQKQAEVLLKESEKRFTTAFESSPAPLAISEIETGCIINVNNRWVEMLGFTREEQIGRTSNELGIWVNPADRKRILTILSDKGSLNDQYVMFKTKSGDIIHALWSAEMIDFAGKQHILSLVQDVTDRMRIEHELKESMAKLEENQKASLNLMEDLYSEVEERTKAEEQIREYAATLASLFSAAPIGIGLAIDRVMKKVNQQMLQLLGYSEDELLGKTTEMVYPDKAEYERVGAELYKQIDETGTGTLETRFRSKDGQIMDILLSSSPLDPGDMSKGVTFTALDITEMKKYRKQIEASLKEKDVLLKEIHHRVKNNLQVVSSLLALQSFKIKDEETLRVLQDSRNRIHSMAAVHERLYQSSDFSKIDFDAYMRQLAKSLLNIYSISKDVKLEFQSENVQLAIDKAVPCGLILNELLSNALKYAFEDKKEGTIIVSIFREEQHRVVLMVKDDGKGLPENFDISKTDTLGLQLVNVLTEQLDGSLTIQNKGGVEISLSFSG